MSIFSEDGGRSSAGLRSRFLLSAKSKENITLETVRSRRDKNGRTVLPMYSDFFSHATGKMMVTANQYEFLHKEIGSVIEACSTKERILLNVYVDSETATELDMEGLIVGFRRYISANRRRMIQLLKKRFAGTFLFFFIGIILKYLSLEIEWIASHTVAGYISDILTELLIWQFAAFVAIDLFGELRKIRRLAQIEKIEFSFKHWE